MSVGRLTMRGWAFQARAFAPWAVASASTAGPQDAPRDGVAIEFRGRAITQGVRTRLAQVAFRGRSAEGRAWR